jgi:hypothetical protein
MSFYLLHTTYLILFLSVFARQLCLPVPAVLFLLFGGASAGTGRLSFVGIVLVAVLGCLFWATWFDSRPVVCMANGYCVSCARSRPTPAIASVGREWPSPKRAYRSC